MAKVSSQTPKRRISSKSRATGGVGAEAVRSRKGNDPNAARLAETDQGDHNDDDHQTARLAQLEAYGNAFLASFDMHPSSSSSAAKPSDVPAWTPSSLPSTRKGKSKALPSSRSDVSRAEEQEKNHIDRMFEGSDPEEEAWSGIADSDDAGSTLGSLHDRDDDDDNTTDAHPGASDEEEQQDDAVSIPKERTHLPSNVKAKADTALQPMPKAPKSRPVQTVVFGGDASTSASPLDAPSSKKGWKAFMSSKISKISEDPSDPSGSAQARLNKGDADEEAQLETNDRLLSHLLSTTLFAPGGAGRETKKRNLSSNDTLARIIELSATESQRKGAAVGRGWGETELQRRQLARMPAKIRQDIRRGNAEKRDRERDKAKELGTWHPSLKANFSNRATATEMGAKAEPKKRLRGIGPGIGKFKDGTLSLSKSDVRKINGPDGGARGDSKNKRRKK